MSSWVFVLVVVAVPIVIVAAFLLFGRAAEWSGGRPRALAWLFGIAAAAETVVTSIG